MRTREQRWAARSARGWPRLRVHAVLNGLGALVAGAGLLWFTHGPLQFRNFPAGEVGWAWRVVTLALAVLVPCVLLAMGGYLLLAGATATQRAALDLVEQADRADRMLVDRVVMVHVELHL